MVPVEDMALRQRIDGLRQSVDLNIRDLIARADSPLPLSVYLWCLRRHRLSFVNGDTLAQWGIGWVRRIFVDREIGAHVDEEVSAAALAAVALYGAMELRETEDALRHGLKYFVAVALERSLVAYERPTYSTLLLLAATVYGIEEPRLRSAIQATADAFIQMVPGGRLFGAGFLMALLTKSEDGARWRQLYAALHAAVSSDGTQYEDRIYVLHALILSEKRAAGQSVLSEDDFRLIEKELDSTPGWSFVMAGDETIPPEGDPEDRIVLSPLYRGVLLDLSLGVQAELSARREARLEAKYRGDRAIVVSAFVFWSLLLVIPPTTLAVLVSYQLDPLYRYFILHQYGEISSGLVIWAMTALVALGFLAPFAALTIIRLWRPMVKRAAQSDQRAQQIAFTSAVDVFGVWWRVVIITVALGLLDAFLYAPLAHLLGSQ